MELATLPQLTRDVRKAATTMEAHEARFLVDTYYSLQKFRIRAGNQVLALSKTDEPHETVGFFFDQFYQLEKDIAKALDTYSNAQPTGEWARANVGIGPVIAAGLLAHIDITKSPTPSALWSFAGLAPGQRYVKGEKRSWNASLKVLCWKMGDSFVKQSGRENCYYGHVYLQRKAKEVARNDAVRMIPLDTLTPAQREGIIVEQNGVVIGSNVFVGGNCEAAARTLAEKTVRDKEYRAVLEAGKLPPGQLDMRARRYAVKRFLTHFWQAAYWIHFKTQPPRAYVFDQLNHVDEDPPPVPFAPYIK